ncbi:MAG: RNA polymerase sigma factor [Bacteroidetes bacterium]|nr:RNA polymerase sigma factor [Bacteroidota bacterium]
MDNQEEIYISIYNEYRDKILRICFAYLDDKSYAEDVYQEVLLAIWTGLRRFRNESAYGTWVYRITVNTIFLFNKQERKRKPGPISENIIDSSVSEMEQKIRKEKNLEKLYQAIASLGEFDRMLIGLYLEKLKYEEIGSILGITTSHVGVKISRIKLSIQKQLNL